MGEHGRDGHARSDGTETLSRETSGDTKIFEKTDPVCAVDAVFLEYVVGIEHAKSVCELVADRGNAKGWEIVRSEEHTSELQSQ